METSLSYKDGIAAHRWRWTSKNIIRLKIFVPSTQKGGRSEAHPQVRRIYSVCPKCSASPALTSIARVGRLIRVSWQDQSDKIQSITVQWEPISTDGETGKSPLTTIEELCMHIYKRRKKINLVSERQAHRPFVSVAKNS
jgi:hypothetical protein